MKQKLIAYLKANWKHLLLVGAGGAVHLLGQAHVIDRHTSNELAGALATLGVMLIGTSGTQAAQNNATQQDEQKKS